VCGVLERKTDHMPMKETIQRLRTVLRLDAHHATERFGVVVAMFAVTFVMVITGSAASAISRNVEKTSETALYNESFTTSQTGVNGSVAGVYVSNDRMRSLVLMRFSNDQSTVMSTDANNYEAFLTGSDTKLAQQQLKQAMSGEIVVFGTSGYLGVVIDSDAPFPKQILALTLRAKSKLVYNKNNTELSRPDLQNDASFTEFDQWRVFVNPGAHGATVSSALSNVNEAFSPTQAYYEFVVKTEEEAAREVLDEQLAKMQVDLAQIDEFTAQMATTQVGGLRIVPPEVPVQIAGDTVTGTPGDVDDPLRLHTRWVAPTGWDFDWRAGSIRHGYLDALTPEGITYVQFLAEHAQQGKPDTTISLDAFLDEVPALPGALESEEAAPPAPDSEQDIAAVLPGAELATPGSEGIPQDATAPHTLESVADPDALSDPAVTLFDLDAVPVAPLTGDGRVEPEVRPFNVNNLVWKLNDGSDLSTDYSGSSDTMKPLIDIKNRLSQAYQSYYTNKVTYQVQHYNTLIALEVALKNVESSAHTNHTPTALQTY